MQGQEDLIKEVKLELSKIAETSGDDIMLDVVSLLQKLKPKNKRRKIMLIYLLSIISVAMCIAALVIVYYMIIELNDQHLISKIYVRVFGLIIVPFHVFLLMLFTNDLTKLEQTLEKIHVPRRIAKWLIKLKHGNK